MKKTKEELKQYFESGDKPTQAQYADLIDSYIDAQQSEGSAERSFVIDEKGAVSIAEAKKIPVYDVAGVTGNKISFLKDGEVLKEIDLAQYAKDSSALGDLPERNYHSSYLPKFRDVVIDPKTNLLHKDMHSDWVAVPLNEGYTATSFYAKLEGRFLLLHAVNLSGGTENLEITAQLPYKIQYTQYFRGGGTAGMQDYKIRANSTALQSMGALQGFNEFFAVLMVQVN